MNNMNKNGAIMKSRSTHLLNTLVSFALMAAIQTVSAQMIPDYITGAVASDARVEAMTERDAARHPAEILTLSGIKPGDTVIEFAGFGQYYTTMLAEIVGAQGQIHMFDLPYMGEAAGAASTKFVKDHPNTYYHLVDYNIATLPENVDIVYNVLYYHDLPLNNIDTAALNRKIFAALKPGGVFLIVDHNAEAGSGTRDVSKLHRIDPAVIKTEVLAAGFVLAEESNLLRVAEDDHTKMVFSPGTRGATDRSVFKFVKP